MNQDIVKKIRGDAPQRVTVVKRDDGRLCIVFDRPAGWLAFNPDEAIRFADHLKARALEMKHPLIVIGDSKIAVARKVTP